MRAYRNMTLYLPGGLVGIPVSLATAASEGSEPRPTVCGSEGQKLARVYYDEYKEEALTNEDTYREFDGRIISQQRLAEIKEAAKIDHLEISEVCPLNRLDFRRAKGTYYIYSPKKNGNHKAFDAFVKGLKNKMAICKWCPSGRQQILAIHVEGNILLGTVLTFADKFRHPDDDCTAHTEVKASKDEVAIVTQLLDTVTGNGESLDTLEDDAIELMKAEIRGANPAPEIPRPVAKGGTLMDELKESLKATKAKTRGAKVAVGTDA